jgi:3',5'-nucleoside bisphosphate phosphatase
MTNRIDLHMHSTASDGGLKVEELMKLVETTGLNTIALTDHDTTDGLDTAIEMGRNLGFEVIPGIELSADAEGEVHVLGYFLDYKNAEFQKQLDIFRERRLGRGEAIVKRLRDMGFAISWEQVLEIALGGSVGRPHIAQALRDTGYVTSIDEAFKKYLYDGGPAYVERKKITTVEAVELIRSVGGIAVLAHPTYVKEPETVLAEMVQAGLSGIECHYGHYDDATVERLLGLAKKYNLVATGGSDFHGRDDNDPVHAYVGSRYVPLQSLVELKARAEKPV